MMPLETSTTLSNSIRTFHAAMDEILKLSINAYNSGQFDDAKLAGVLNIMSERYYQMSEQLAVIAHSTHKPDIVN